MAGIIGKKIGMTSVYSAEGKNLPCTIIEAGPCVVTQIKTQEKDGYESTQLGFEDKKEKRKSFLRSLIKSVDTGANGTQDYIVKKGSGKNKIAKTRQ